MNQLVFKLSTYAKTLAECGGVVPEFVNPKYADETRTAFKKPTRLECMMQDLPKQLPPGSNVGFTMVVGGGDGQLGGRGMDCIRFYSPVKNNVADAVKKQRAGGSASCASSGEHQVYETMYRLLHGVGVKILEDTHVNQSDSGEAKAYVEKEWLGVRLRVSSHCAAPSVQPNKRLVPRLL